MKFARFVPVFLLSLAIFPVARADPPAAAERWAAASVLALGQLPDSPADATGVSFSPAMAGLSVAEMVAKFRAPLQGDTPARRSVVQRAFVDSFGRAPDDHELAAAAAGSGIYAERVKAHLAWLAAHPQDYAAVLNRAYQFVIRRDIYPEEIEYWKKQDTLSYVLLVGCIDDWARRNQPGLMVTAGTPTISVNCTYLATVRLSPAVAAEARAAAGLAAVSERDRTANPGRHVIAPGADKIESSGRIYFVLAGRRE